MSFPPSNKAEKNLFAVIGENETDPIPFSGQLFASHSKKFWGSGQREGNVVFDSKFQRESVIQFLAACQNEKPELTPSNVFEIEDLCIEWEVDSSILDQIKKFVENPPTGPSLLVPQLRFLIAHHFPTAEVEAMISQNLIQFIDDPQLIEVPIPNFTQIVNFEIYQDDSESFRRIFTFCLRYYTKQGSKASKIFRTLKTSQLTNANLESLCSLRHFHWCCINASIGKSVLELIEVNRNFEKKFLEQSQSLEEARNELSRAINELGEEVKLLKQKQETQRAEQKDETEVIRKDLAAGLSRQEKIQEVISEALPNVQQNIGKLKVQVRMLGVKEFLPSDEIQKLSAWRRLSRYDKVPIVNLHGIIASLTKECGGNVHDNNIVSVTSSKSSEDGPRCAAKNVADLEDGSFFASDFHPPEEDIPHTRNNWICYDFKARKILVTHYGIRSVSTGVGTCNLKSWILEASIDGEEWLEIDHKENNADLNDKDVTRIFPVSKWKRCNLVRLVNVGRNWRDDDRLMISAWEIFGSLVE